MRARRFPNLFIIGAMKAGTSSLHEYLNQHPKIFMSRFKEPQYFAPHLTRWGQDWGEGQRFPEAGIGWYLRLFEDCGDVAYAGESSVSYTARPWVEGCERRIHAFNPEARLIYLMRDPVERAISHYWHFVVDGREDLDPRAALERRSDYVARSDYAMQIGPYLDVFGRDQIFALTLEELTARPDETFGRLFSWLGLDPAPIDVATSYNVGARQVRQTRRGMVPIDTALKHWRWQAAERYTIPRLLAASVRRVAYRSVDRSAIALDDSVEFLAATLRSRTAELERMLGRRFPEWSTLAGGNGAA